MVYRAPSGRSFHLSGPMVGQEGVRLLPGPTGLDGAPTQLLWREGARQEGATYTGAVVSKREIDIEVDVWGATVRQFRERNQAWMAALSYRERGWLMTWNTFNGWRYLRVRLAEPPEGRARHDPALLRSNQYAITLAADEPYWLGLQEKSLWTNKSGSGAGSLIVRNPGGLPAYPSFVVAGPGKPWIQDGPEGPRIHMPQMSPGEWWYIDTHPRTIDIVSTKNTNPMALMKGKRFRGIYPAHTSTRIDVGVTGGSLTSQIMVLTTPRYQGYLA